VGINTVSAGLREEPGAKVCTISAEAEFFENLSQNFLNFLNWESDHSSDILMQLLIVVMCCDNFVSCHPERSAATSSSVEKVIGAESKDPENVFSAMQHQGIL